MPRTWPLVGRDGDLRRAFLAADPRHGHGGVVLSGPAGVGKTRLAREVVARVERSHDVRWVLATESARSLSLGAFNGLVDEPSAFVSLSSAARAVVGDTGPGGVVVAVDDAHLLDDASACLVQRLVTCGEATVVLTLREGEPVPDAVRALWKDAHLARVRLAPLTEPDTRALVARVLGGELESSAAQRLWRLTRGNALFLRHLVDGEVAAGRLRRTGDLWCWAGSPDISPELGDLVDARMGDLRAPVRDVIDVLALAEPLSVAVIESLTFAAALEEAEDRGLVTVGGKGDRVARLAHPMYGEVRRAALGDLRARRLRGLVAGTLAATGESADDPVRRAVLILDSDLPAEPRLFLDAAQRALCRFDLELGERLARAAAAGGDVQARFAHALALTWLARGDDAAPLLAELLTAAETDEEVVRAAAPSVANQFWVLQRPRAAEAVLAEALERTSPGPIQDPLLGMRVSIDASVGRVEPVLAQGPPLLASGHLSGVAAVMAAAGVTVCAGVHGDPGGADRAAEVGYAAAGEAASMGPVATLGEFHVLALRLAGHLGAAERVGERLRGLAEDVAGLGGPTASFALAHARLAVGRCRSALTLLSEARAAFPTPHPATSRLLPLLIEAAAVSGRVSDARQALDQSADVPNVLYRLATPQDQLARAWVVAGEGAVTEAGRAAREAAEQARRLDAPGFEVLALQTAAQFGDPTGADRLEELCGIVEGPRSPAAYAHACALARRDGDALAAVSERWEEIGDGIAAADAAAQAAVLLRAAGRNGSAAVAAARARLLADERCEGARTPAVLAAAQPLPLTAREREIATLAAGGLSNREIAARLMVSVRTVEGHLYRAGHKVGAHDRHELAELVSAG